jgi:hypothetical protein
MYIFEPRKVEVAMFEDKARVLLILPQEVLDRARVFAGEAITKLKGPVSLQMVLRALIDEGLKRGRDRTIVTNIEGQMQAVRAIRSRGGRPAATGPRANGAGRRVGKGRVGEARRP